MNLATMNLATMNLATMNLATMNMTYLESVKIIIPSLLLISITGCAVSTKAPVGANSVREKLAVLQADSQLASRAQVAIKDAETATRAAEKPEKNKRLAAHRVYMADHKVEIAMALAQGRLLEDQREGLLEQRDSAKLDSRTREADRAHQKAKIADEETAKTKQRNVALQQQLADLNAKNTDRGMVITLGDLLFETGKSELKSNTVTNLEKLSEFLSKNQDRKLVIEGYTDNIGSEESNLGLSQRRAEAVKNYLLVKGVASDRMIVLGKGEMDPVSSNNSALGRQQNRRVEVLLPGSTT